MQPHALKAKLMWDFLEEAYAEEEPEEKVGTACAQICHGTLPQLELNKCCYLT